MPQNDEREQRRESTSKGDEDERGPREEIPQDLLEGAGAHDEERRRKGEAALRDFLTSRGTVDPPGEARHLARLASTGKRDRARRAGARYLRRRRRRE